MEQLNFQNLLKKLHLEFITHYYISEINHKYRCDIFIPKQKGINQKTIIECDGCYWHGCPECNSPKNQTILEQIERDKCRTQELKEKGFNVIRLWEHKIKMMDIQSFKEVIGNNLK